MSFSCLFTGDLSATGIFHEKISRQEEIFDKSLLDLFSNSDQIVCNFEGPATNLPFVRKKWVNLKSPANTIEYLSKRGFSIYNLGNNHTFDCGHPGFIETREKIMHQNGMFFGAGENFSEASRIKVIQHNSIKIALVSVTSNEEMIAGKTNPGVFSIHHLDKLKHELASIKKEVNHLILNYHGGEEYTIYPSPNKRKQLKKLLQSEHIDIIVAHHAHVLQGYEWVKEKLVFYSLGNFLFDIKEHQHFEKTKTSALLRCNFTETDVDFEFVPISIDTQKGMVRRGEKDYVNHINNISDFKNYRYKWMKEAYRTFFRITPSENQQANHQVLTTRNRNLFSALFKFKAYRSFFNMLFSKDERSVLINAYLFKLLKSLNLVRE